MHALVMAKQDLGSRVPASSGSGDWSARLIDVRPDRLLDAGGTEVPPPFVEDVGGGLPGLVETAQPSPAPGCLPIGPRDQSPAAPARAAASFSALAARALTSAALRCAVPAPRDR